MIERDGKHLIRTARRIVAALAIDDIVQIPALGVPEPRVERLARALRVRSEIETIPTAMLPNPAVEQAECVVPERVDLDGLPAPGRDDPIIDLRVHPRELIASLPLPQQSVSGIDADAEPGAIEVMPHDVRKHGQQSAECRGVVSGADVAMHGVEEPQRGVGSVIQTLSRAIGEHVWNETVADVVRE